jgi:signal peptidase I
LAVKGFKIMNQSKGIISSWARQALWIIPLAGLFLFLFSSHSFMAVGSGSMKPVLQVGDLVLIHSISPDKLQVGDIIDYRVSSTFRKLYNYPPTICHRIVRIEQTSNGVAFRTKGDNTSEDPFIIMSKDVTGKETGIIRYLGFPVMFIRSRQFIYLVAGLLLLILLYAKGSQIAKGAQKFRGSVFGLSSTEISNFQKEQQQQMRNMTDHVTVSMDKFSTAMSEYAKHLESHTTAVQSLALAARHLEMILAQHEVKSSEDRPISQQKANIKDAELKTYSDTFFRQSKR